MKQNKAKDKKYNKNSCGWYIVMTILLSLATLIVTVCKWAKDTFNVGLDAIINTIFGQLEGTSADTVIPAVKYCVPMIAIVLVLWIVYIVLDYRAGKRSITEAQLKKRRTIRRVISVSAVIYFVGAFVFVQISYDIVGYVLAKFQDTKIYEEHYVSPNDVVIQAKGKQRNLLYIYLESMETTYASEKEGGMQKDNYIPKLTKLAKENISFSNTKKLGGFLPVTGATWTMGALYATTTGLPYSFPIGGNEMEDREEFATGVYSIGDFLNQEGYNQEFLCGSNAAFAGRKTYFEQHGSYTIFDLYTAREQGYVPEDYYEWWGVEDYILYDIAKKELKRLSKMEEPFNLTMLTVDTHHIGGYVCERCENEYEDQTANVVACADRQVNDFIKWCMKQDFYENTTIIVTGDHTRMDSCLVDGIDLDDRTIYNCIINGVNENKEHMKNRQFTALDMYPTILTSLGYEIEGNKLGMGVDLYSGEATLVEQLGFEKVKREFSKSSSYYMEQFAPELSYLTDDEKNAFCKIRFGRLGNAKKYIMYGMDTKTGWTNDARVDFKIPIKDKKKVHVIAHIDATAATHDYSIIQQGVTVYEGKQAGKGVMDFDVDVVNDMCEFSMMLTETVEKFEEKNKIRNNAALKISRITVIDVQD